LIITKILFFESFYFSSVLSSSAPVTGTSIISSNTSALAGLAAVTTTSSGVSTSNLVVSMFNSDNLIEDPISSNLVKSTLIQSIKFFGNTFTSISFICSSNIAHSITA